MTSTTRVTRTAQTAELDLFRLYLDQIGRHRLLTAEDEVRLTQPTRPAWTPAASSPTAIPTTLPARTLRRSPSGASGRAAR
ncbi:MAG TPA: sigma-70 factor domain-containing protein [Actinomycetota bacterium]|jgi:hypothetical protein|nr:sigma-70 factor domain-containing protein [Actinomycetota bacterium]